MEGVRQRGAGGPFLGNAVGLGEAQLGQLFVTGLSGLGGVGGGQLLPDFLPLGQVGGDGGVGAFFGLVRGFWDSSLAIIQAVRMFQSCSLNWEVSMSVMNPGLTM